MSDKIRLLPEVVANQIAAGEVVNRPASVVKEMMENAIDAGARTVKVNFRDGGKDLIQIVDDGCGMSPIDARMAFDRHATSKITSVDDIYALRTFGFRGEALASIAAVSQVELRTRQQADELGSQTEINGGQFAAQVPVACSVGSQFFVRNLFYNVPARRRFLDKSTVSASQIKSEFQRVALCNPSIAFELYANDAPVYRLDAAPLAARIVDVVGRHIKQNLLEVQADTSIARIEGYIGRPAAAKRRNSEQYLFVNGRFFRSSYLNSAIMKGYEKLIPESSAPSYFLYLEVDPGRIDVNVHPQKTEVRFADEEAVWQIVNAAVRETLAKTGAVPLMDFDRDSTVEIPVLKRGAVYSEPRAMSNQAYNPFNDTYIDPSAPDPNVDFTGFDVPFRSDGEGYTDIPAGSAASGNSAGPGRGVAPRVPVDTDADTFDVPAADDADPIRPWAPRAGAPVRATGPMTSGDEFSGQTGPGHYPSFDAANDCAVSDLRGESFDDFESAASFENSGLDFIPSSALSEQQRLGIDEQLVFEGTMPLVGGYIASRLGGRLVVVDVRRARERILYENYLTMLGKGASVCQRLLFPERLVLSESEYALLEENAVEFAALGFDIDFGEDGAVEVKGTPADLPADTVDQLLFELLQAFASPVSLADVRREKIAAAMARGAAKAVPRNLSPEEAAALLCQLSATGNISFSPSGKAISAEITTEDIRARLG